MVALTLQDANCIGVRAHVWSIIAMPLSRADVARHERLSGRTKTLPRVKTRLSVTRRGDKGHSYLKQRLAQGVPGPFAKKLMKWTKRLRGVLPASYAELGPRTRITDGSENLRCVPETIFLRPLDARRGSRVGSNQRGHSTMGKAQAFFVMDDVVYALIFPATNFLKKATELVLHACALRM
jgi:hypothetical protein